MTKPNDKYFEQDGGFSLPSANLETIPHTDTTWRDFISRKLVEHNMPTRQAFINDMLSELTSLRQRQVEAVERMKLSWKHPLDETIPMKDTFNQALNSAIEIIQTTN